LAKALAPNITVNVVAAGSMPTRWMTLLTGKPDTEERKQAARDGVPLKRFAELEDVAAAVLMAAKNDSMTGQVVTVDAGFCLLT
jgi:3-oxoacyl-[acyl-carrier protein] reductase